MKYCRIDLTKTDYKKLDFGVHMPMVQRDDCMEDLQQIYRKYCEYKQFESVMPLFIGLIFDKYTDVIAYCPDNKFCAFSLIKRYDSDNIESLQFAWDYANPELRLGIRSLEHECAVYKSQGYRYLYLGEAADYKSQLDGYEILGPIDV